METKFGKFITTKTFAVLFIAILAAAMGYMGVRIGNAVEWACGRGCISRSPRCLR
jgi:hypothetical protein